MVKRLLLLSLLFFSLLPCVHAEQCEPLPPPYNLEPVEWLDKDEEYTLISRRTPVVADPVMLALMGGESEEVGSVADEEQTIISGELLLEQGFHVLSVSPDGQIILCSEGDRLYLLTGSTLRAVVLNLSRCAATQQNGFRQSMRYASMKPAAMVGSEGFRWSPDGKYLCLLNARRVYGTYQSAPLMLIDAEKGEMFSIRVYHQMGRILSTAMQGLFSPDSRYLYYTELLEGNSKLFRYSLDTQKHELLFDTFETLYGFPALGMNEDGDLLCVMSVWENILLTFREGSGGWLSTQKMLPRLNVLLFSAAGQGAMMELAPPGNQPDSKIQFLQINGRMWHVTAETKDNRIHFYMSPPYDTTEEAFSDTQEAKSEGAQMLAIRHVAMSPGGSCYLLALELQNDEKPLSFYLLSAQTKTKDAMVAVTLPEEMKTCQPFFQRGISWYAAGITFLTEDLLLVPGKPNQTHLYRLVRSGHF